MAHRALSCLVFAAVLWCAGTESARANAFLHHASPAVGSTVHTSPSTVRLKYTEELKPTYSRARVEDASGAVVSTAAAHIDEYERSVLIVLVGALKPGRYKVIWNVLSVDTHMTRGTFDFAVAP